MDLILPTEDFLLHPLCYEYLVTCLTQPTTGQVCVPREEEEIKYKFGGGREKLEQEGPEADRRK